MKKVFIQLFFWVLGGVLLWLAFKGQDFDQIVRELKKVDYRWGLLVLLASFVGHISRAMRWKLLLQPLQDSDDPQKLSLGNIWWAMMFGYLVNLGVPRLGELSRCIAVHRSEKLRFEAVLGTVVAERAIDIFCLFSLLIFTFFYQFQIVSSFFKAYIFIPFQQLLVARQWLLYGLVVCAIVGLLLLWLFWTRFQQFSWFRKLYQFTREVFKGLLSIYHMPQRWAFLGHTLLIWLAYFFMTYWWFFSIPATQNLGLDAGLFLLVVGSIGKSVPIQGGGMGAYHFLVTKGLSLAPFLISSASALALATIIHLAQTIFYLLVGGVGAVVVFYKNRQLLKNNK